MKENNNQNWPEFSCYKNSNKTSNESSFSITDSLLSTSLHHAHIIKDYGQLKELVNKFANLNKVNSKDCFDETALTKAVYFGNDLLVKLLLKNGADIDVRDYIGKTVLHYIQNLNDKEVVEALVKKCSQSQIINDKDQDGYTSLDIALFHNNIHNMELLFKYGASINICDNFYYICCKMQNRGAQEFMIKKYDQLAIINLPDQSGYTPLALSIIRCNNKITRLLLKYGADIKITDKFGQNPLHHAWRIEDLDALKMLVTKGASAGIINDKNSLGETPLDKAIVNGNSSLMMLLIENNAEPNITGYAKNLLSGDFEDSSSEE